MGSKKCMSLKKKLNSRCPECGGKLRICMFFKDMLMCDCCFVCYKPNKQENDYMINKTNKT